MATYPLIDFYCHIYPEKFFQEMTKVSPQTENLGKRLRTITKLFDLDEPVVLGHEFCAKVVEYGPGARETLAPGTRVVSVPILLRPQPVQIGFGGVDTPGGYAEYMVLSEDLLIPVPDTMASDIAALAEPLTVALHAVNRGALGSDDVPIVIGCGPIGLAVIATLARILCEEVGTGQLSESTNATPFDD